MQLSLSKIALLADLHLSMTDMSAGRDSQGIPIRLIDKLAILKSILIDLQSKKVETVVILGDIFETPNGSDFLKMLFYLSLVEYSGKLIILLGNHDYASENYYNFSSDQTLIWYYGLQDRFLILKEPKTIGNVDFVPWMPEEQLIEYFESLSSVPVQVRKSEVLLGHFGVNGASVSEYDSSHVGEVSTRYLSFYRRVFLGHYHLPQKYYVGSPFRNHHGEANYNCGYIILDLCSLDYERVSTNDRDFLTVRLEADKSESLGSAISKYKEEHQIVLDGSIVKVRIVGHRESIPLIDKFQCRKVLIALGVQSVTFDYEYLTDDSEAILLSRDFIGGASMKEQFSLYCEAKKIEQSITNRAIGFLDD